MSNGLPTTITIPLLFRGPWSNILPEKVIKIRLKDKTYFVLNFTSYIQNLYVSILNYANKKYF